jgi:diamine N-acetyltransferase
MPFAPEFGGSTSHLANRAGYGRFAVASVAYEARRRGQARITVLWVRGQGGPEEFYLRLGFRPTGEELGGETVGELYLRTD